MKFNKECEALARIRWDESETIRVLVMETKEESNIPLLRACISEEGTFTGKQTNQICCSLTLVERITNKNRRWKRSQETNLLLKLSFPTTIRWQIGAQKRNKERKIAIINNGDQLFAIPSHFLALVRKRRLACCRTIILIFEVNVWWELWSLSKDRGGKFVCAREISKKPSWES